MKPELLPADRPLYSLRDAREVLRISERTLRTHIEAGRLRRIRIGGKPMIRRDDLEAFIDAATSGGEGQRDHV